MSYCIENALMHILILFLKKCQGANTSSLLLVRDTVTENSNITEANTADVLQKDTPHTWALNLDFTHAR